MTTPSADGELRRSALFAGLPAAALRALGRAAEPRALQRGQRLWAAGQPASHVGLLLSGRLKAVRHAGGRETILDIAMPGDVVGDVAFVLREPHAVDVLALRRSRVLLLPAAAVREAFSRDPLSLSSALFSLARRAQRLMRLVESLSAGNVERRLAAVLLSFADRAGEPFPGGLLVPLRLRRAELAALAATSKESVSRTLAEFERGGLLTTLPAGYLIHDPAALRRTVAGI